MLKVSIITINYNNAFGLQRTIESVINQSFKDFEYCIIDAASTDGSVDVIKAYSNKISKWLSEPDTGIYNAMNKGIQLATGDYFLFLNSGDTLVNPDILNFVIPELGVEDLVYGNLNIIERDNIWFKAYPDKLLFSYFIIDSLPHPATFIKRRLFDQIGLYNEELKIIADWEFFLLAIAKHSCSYKHIPLTISNFAYDGISSKEESLEIREYERRRALEKSFSLFLSDYKELEKLRSENLLLKSSRLYKLNQKLKKLLK